MKVLFVYPRFDRHAAANPELLDWVPLDEYLGSPSLGMAQLAACTPDGWEVELRDDRLASAARPTDADLVALSFFTPAANRAFELARYFRADGKAVVAGGIFPTLMPDETAAHFDAVVVGEGEEVWPRLLHDHVAGRLAPRYQSLGSLDLSSLPLPRISLYLAQEGPEFRPDDYPVQISRGCPLTCQACVLPTSMTRQLRELPWEHVVGQLAQLASAGKHACLTEDTSWFPGHARNRLGQVFDHVAAIGAPSISYIGISMPMILHTPAALFARARAAGVAMLYLVGGFDPISTRAFTGRDPQALGRAFDAIAKAHDAGIEPYTSFLLGDDQDDEGTVDRMLDFAGRAGIRKAEFAIYTPYPGTPAWHRLLAEGRILHRDWSRYNDANVVFRPAQLTPNQLRDGYLRLWREFYAGKRHLAALPREERTIQF